jgi:hypothetical protein
MSFSEEKMYVLKMLEEGKISSEEAARLISAVESGKQDTNDNSSFRQQKKVNFSDEITKVKDRLSDWKKEFKNNYSQKDFDRAVEDFSNKAEKLGKNVAHTTIGIADKLIDFVGSFIDTNSFNVFGKYTAVERAQEVNDVSEGMELKVEGINGNILVKKHAEDKIILKSLVRSPIENADEILDFSHDGNSIVMKCNKIGNISVSHELFLPSVKFKSISLVTKNGKIYVEDSIAESFEANTSNSHIDLMGVNSDTINVSTKNAKIQLGYVIGRNINVNTDNTVIDIKHIKSENINAVTRNGRILVENIHNYEGKNSINMNLKTAQAGIKINMNDMDKRGYKIKANTTNGEINLLIPEITYLNASKQISNSFVEAESSGYETFEQKVNIQAETVNGYIEIVK